jgi:hypothetical protein
MIARTTLLFALPGFRLLNVTLDPDGGRVVLVERVAVEGDVVAGQGPPDLPVEGPFAWQCAATAVGL